MGKFKDAKRHLLDAIRQETMIMNGIRLVNMMMNGIQQETMIIMNGIRLVNMMMNGIQQETMIMNGIQLVNVITSLHALKHIVRI